MGGGLLGWWVVGGSVGGLSVWFVCVVCVCGLRCVVCGWCVGVGGCGGCVGVVVVVVWWCGVWCVGGDVVVWCVFVCSSKIAVHRVAAQVGLTISI